MPEEQGNPFKVNTSTMGRFGAGGLLTGASLASILGLIKMLSDMKADKSRDEDDETGLDRLVLTLPAKKAEAEDYVERLYNEEFCKSIPTIGPEMEKSANWQTLVASLLAAGGGAAASYALVDKLFEIRRMRELEQQLQASQQEYLDKLDTASSEVKSAGIFDAFDSDRTGEPSFNKLDYPVGLAILATLLGAGGSAWLTKRFLDQTDDEDTDPGFKPRKPIKVKRIVFRTAKEGDEKEASAEEVDPEVLQAAVGVYLDICSGSPTLGCDEKVASELKKIGMTAGELYKKAADNEEFNNFMYILAANPELREQMKRMSMDKHPILKYFKWAVGLPFISSMSDPSLYEEINKEYGPASDMWPDAFKKSNRVLIPDMAKQGSVLDSLIGSMAAEKAVESMSGAMRKKKEVPEESEDGDEELKSMVRELEIGTADEGAEEFVSQREQQIKEILTKLVREGKI